MAPELRKRKVATDSQKSQGPTAKAPEKASKVKRKASDDTSPVSSKKQRSTKPTSTRAKPTDKPSRAVKVDKAEKPSNADKTTEIDNVEKPPKAATKTKTGKEETKADKTEKPSKANKTEKPSKADKTEKSSKADKTEKPPKADKTKRPTKPAVAVEKVEPVSAETAPDSEEQEDDGVLLLADELDSGEEDAAGETALFKPGQDVGKIPTISGDLLKASKPLTGERGVIYIGRIPHGFYEYEMRQYLSQFGPVSRIRLSRNRKTGASKHFAFVEFESESTAEIVTKTMDNYLLFGHILKVKMVPKSQLHEELFKGANRRFKKVPWNKMAGLKLAKPRSQSAWEAKVEKERANRAQRADKLKAIGYEFEAPDLKDVPAAVPAEDVVNKVEAIEAAPAGEGGGDEAEGASAHEAEETPEAEAETTKAPKAKAPKKKGTKSGKVQKTKA
ncbi:hypothetical protein G6O67_004769 [Ophiocordyceps sinensis]|uniref:RRM domain-containing protein n=1 Tax=Ophiocordyceps sinensis TaxID=72228 RepID=A0A8H4V566_9HYPO|nr:hypothetical protein G6O67_004769 [Ophiocordyceps sinensis]